MLNVKKIFATILCIVMLLSCVSVNGAGVQILNGIDTTNGEVVSEFYSNLLDYIVKYYRYDITREELMEAAVTKILTDHPELLEDFGKGAFEALDENSMFYSSEEFETRFEDVSGVYVGIGINVYFDEEYVILGEALPNSPAESSGLQVGDIVVAVDGESVEGFGLDKVTSLIKG
ncbi:MAG: PDZ domain-containing protein, partial [Clostridia bacterium]|nr:PDZ domain-containing protein [Clostridia bacterium]